MRVVLRLLAIALAIGSGSVALSAVTRWKGLEPGRSTRVEVEKILGAPARAITPRLVVYEGQPGIGRIVAEYREDSVVNRIEINLLQPVARAGLIENFKLVSIKSLQKPQPDGKAAEYFGETASLVFFYDSPSLESGIARIGFYSRALFDQVTGAELTDGGPPMPPRPKDPIAPPPPPRVNTEPPAVTLNPGACPDIFYWAQTEQDAAKRSRNAVRRQSLFDILIASQRGECERARKEATAYKVAYGRQ